MPQRIVLRLCLRDPAKLPSGVDPTPEDDSHLSFRSTVWTPREGHTDGELDEALAACSRLREELLELARKDPVVSNVSSAPLYVGWLNTEFRKREGEVRGRLWEIGQPKGELVRLWVDRDGLIMPGAVYMDRDFFLKAACASTPSDWERLGETVWNWLGVGDGDEEEVTEEERSKRDLQKEILRDWREDMGLDPKKEGWSWFWGERPQELVELVYAKHEESWRPGHSERLLECLRGLTRLEQMEEYHWTTTRWQYSFFPDERTDGRYRQFSPWTGGRLRDAWPGGQAPPYEAVFVPVVFIRGLWGLCFHQLYEVTQERLRLSKCPGCGCLQTLTRGQHRDRMCEDCCRRRVRERVQKYRRTRKG